MLEMFTNPGFMPHGFCLRWQTGLLYTHVISDLLIAVAYFSIPLMIVHYLRQRMTITELPPMLLWVGSLFAAFIVLCGVTHVFGLLTIWQPWYGWHGLMKSLTAVVSVTTALALLPIVPKALTLRTAEELETINASLEREIENRKAREAELEERNEALKREIEARTRAEDSERVALEAKAALEQTLNELRATQGRLVESEKLASLGKSIAGIAHEVNTPVGVAITAVSGLVDDTQEVQQAFQQRSLSAAQMQTFLDSAVHGIDLVERNLDRAARLLRSVKQVASDQSNDGLRRIVVREYLELVLQAIRPRIVAARHPVALDCPGDLSLVTNPGALSQLVTNLVLNALTHAYPDGAEGEVRLRLRPLEDGLELRCEDDGCGIPADHLEKVFEPFFTTRGGEGGTGLGLDICRALVEDKLNGSITLESEIDRGSQFIVRLSNLSADTGAQRDG